METYLAFIMFKDNKTVYRLVKSDSEDTVTQKVFKHYSETQDKKVPFLVTVLETIE